MKKMIMALSLTLILISCGKDYTCDCTANDSVNNESFLLENYKEEDAKSKCDEFNNSGLVDGWSCELN